MDNEIRSRVKDWLDIHMGFLEDRDEDADEYEVIMAIRRALYIHDDTVRFHCPTCGEEFADPYMKYCCYCGTKVEALTGGT
jgi:predicted RNA-binding Zn-ribbon protein involved in translation (DUF1610 family)